MVLIVSIKGKMATQTELSIASEIMKTVRRLELPLKLDEITEGRGNCFPLSILAQGRRSEIFSGLSSLTQTIMLQNDPTQLRREVYKFMNNSRHRTIQNYKKTVVLLKKNPLLQLQMLLYIMLILESVIKLAFVS